MTLPKIQRTLALFLLATLSAAPALFADDSPAELLEATIREVIDTLHDQETLGVEDKRNKILDLLQQRFSFDIIIRRALGRNWRQLDETQQEQVTNLISDLLIQAYTRELKNGPKPEINFLGTEELSSSKIEISSTVSYKNNLVAVSYRLANVTGRGWQVYDVLVEGVSMVSNYRQQFDEHFQTKNAKQLIELLKSKIETPDV